MTQTNQKTELWLARHHVALQQPRGIEIPIVSFRTGLLEYGLQHAAEFQGCALGGDSELGAAWLQMSRSYMALLNGPTGRLDCGTLDGEVRRWAEGFGFEEEVYTPPPATVGFNTIFYRGLRLERVASKPDAVDRFEHEYGEHYPMLIWIERRSSKHQWCAGITPGCEAAYAWDPEDALDMARERSIIHLHLMATRLEGLGQ